ncbi:hypothetical protein [Arthrobacter nitrophenolicus]|nr:hypothetical protein [Arthrobacter nitrophenolicus]
MILLLAAVLVMAAVLLLKPPHGAPARLRRAAGHSRAVPFPGAGLTRPWIGRKRRGSAGMGSMPAAAALTLVVQQLAALLKGGRTPGRLWDELWVLYGAEGGGHPGHFPASPFRLHPARSPDGNSVASRSAASGSAASGSAASRPEGRPGAGLSAGSVAVLASARAAAAGGTPVSEAIRRTLDATPAVRNREARIWSELAACLDIAEASGCPLADVLTRFAAQLEVEDDADAARQTALAGPKATVTLLTWLPLMGLGLGVALGVDPVAVLLGTPLGLAALAAGLALTAAGRVWSARLVSAAAGAGVP